MTCGDDWPRGELALLVLVTLGHPSPSLLTLGLTSLAERSTLLSPSPGHFSRAPDTSPVSFCAPLAWQEGGLPWPSLSKCLLLVAGRNDLLCRCLFFPVVSSDSDSDSDLSSSSLEDRLPPTGVRDLKGDKIWGESGKPEMQQLLSRAPSAGDFAASLGPRSPASVCRVVLL